MRNPINVRKVSAYTCVSTTMTLDIQLTVCDTQPYLYTFMGPCIRVRKRKEAYNLVSKSYS